MAKEFTVAIELGSSKITGIAGRRNMDGSISVLAVVSEDSTECIRKGIIYNIDKTCQCLTNIIKRLRTQLRAEINYVYVGFGGQSIRSVRNVIIKDLPEEEVVTQEMVDELLDTNRAMAYPDQEIIYHEIQEYKVGTQYHLDPVGISCKRLEGNVLNILWRKKFFKNLNNCFETAGIAIVDMMLAPRILAESVLTDNERRSGCMLVDLGADTTTVSVYFKNILRHLAVIPLGGNNITKDLTSLHIEESDAERLKIEMGSAWTDNNEIENNQMITIDAERQVEKRRFVEIIEARVREIIENVWHQVPQDYTDKLTAGIIITGGGSNMKNIDKAFKNFIQIDKVRVAKQVKYDISSNDPSITAADGTMNTILGLLVNGDMNCAGRELSSDGELFTDNDDNTDNNAIEEPHRQPRQLGETEVGVVLTEAEKKKAEEERQQKADRLREEEEEEERRRQKEEEERKRQNSPMNKLIKSVKSFLTQIVNDKAE